MTEAFPIIWKARPLIRLFGDTGRQAADALDQLRPAVVKDLRAALDVPDEFNAIFASRGWVAYWGLGADVMRRAIEFAQAGDLEGAEAFLADYHDRDALEYHLTPALDTRVVGKREHLLRKAIEDHIEARYHASVPVVLAQLDGIAIDLTGRYFFARPTFYGQHPEHMVAADTFAGHPSGLRVLATVLGAYRAETTTTPLDTPYRHGILHGRDLGYDTKLASSKSFAALFAVAEWAGKAERGQLDAALPPAWPDLNRLDLADLWLQVRGLYDMKKQQYIRRRTGRPIQRTPAMRATYAERIPTRLGIDLDALYAEGDPR